MARLGASGNAAPVRTCARLSTGAGAMHRRLFLLKTYGIVGLPRQRRAEPELELHASIAQYLDTVLTDESTHTAVPAGGGGDWHGKRQKRKGYRAGWPDHQILSGGHLYCLEIKVGANGLSEAQREAHRAIIRAGCMVVIVRSIDDVAACLRAWRIPTREHRPTPVDSLREALRETR